MTKDRNCEHIHLEHDGKLLLVDIDGNGPSIPKKGRTDWDGEDFLIRLPTPVEATNFTPTLALGFDCFRS